MTMNWAGVMPAITTCFDDNLEIDHDFTAKHVKWLVENVVTFPYPFCVVDGKGNAMHIAESGGQN